jgi:hypothetical protein
MSDWEEYKKRVKATNIEIGKDIEEVEEWSSAMSATIEKNAEKPERGE